jgi:hypothetical protein
MRKTRMTEGLDASPDYSCPEENPQQTVAEE